MPSKCGPPSAARPANTLPSASPIVTSTVAYGDRITYRLTLSTPVDYGISNVVRAVRPAGSVPQGAYPSEEKLFDRVVRTALVIDRRKLRATLFKAGKQIWTSRVGIGAPCGSCVVITIAPGQALPGLGKVQANEKRGKAWIVVTDKGFIGAEPR